MTTKSARKHKPEDIVRLEFLSVLRALWAADALRQADQTGSYPVGIGYWLLTSAEAIEQQRDFDATHFSKQTDLAAAAYWILGGTREDMLPVDGAPSLADLHKWTEAYPDGTTYGDLDGYLFEDFSIPEIIRLLLAEGANANHKAEDGSTLLQGCDCAELAQLLIDHGADATARNDSGETTLHRCENLEVARLLIAHGADATARSETGESALHGCENADVVTLLLSNGADVNAVNEERLSALHTAHSPGVVVALLKGGANALLSERWGNTPLDMANEDLEGKKYWAEGQLLADALERQRILADATLYATRDPDSTFLRSPAPWHDQ